MNVTLSGIACCILPIINLDVDLQYTDCTDSLKAYKN